MQRKSDKRRLELLGSAGTAMALLVAGSTLGAHVAAAATANTSLAIANGDKTAVSQTVNDAAVSAIIDDADGGVQTDATSGTSTTNTVTGNDVLAAATGNAFVNQIDLSTVEATGVTGGAAAMGLATNETASPITSSVTNNDVSVDLTNFSNGSAVNDGNTISATTTANKGSTLLSGAISNDFASAATGSAVTSTPGTSSNLSGSLLSSTHQTSLDPANTATAGGNSITTVIDSTGDNTVTASPSVSQNAIAASVTGNASQSTISIAGDDTPTYAGSAVVGNVQESTGAGTNAALNSGSTISGEVYASGIFVNTLTGALAVEDNSISSAASNNVALGTGGGSGNEIILDDALSVASNANPASGSTMIDAGFMSSAIAAADLAVQNVQIASGDADDERLTTSADTLGADVLGAVEYLGSGSISVSGNAVTATAQSNAASSRIVTGEDAALLNASAAIGNLQGSTNADIAASNLGGTIRAVVDEGFMTSNVAADGNAVRASAYGNQSSQSMDLRATSLAEGSAQVSISAEAVTVVSGPLTVANRQTNSDSTVSADQSSNISVDWLATSDSSMIGSSLSAAGNTQEAVAVGNSSGNALALTGTTVGTGAGIGNHQAGDATSSVIASSTGTQVGSFARDGITDSEAVVNDNLQRSIAYGASTGNTLSVDGNTLTIGTSGATDIATTANFDPVTPGVLNPQVQSAYGVLNRQAQAGDVSATAVSQTAFENRVEGDMAGSSTLQTDGNSFVAAAYGTDARNTASIETNSIDTDGDGFASVAAVTNAQTVTGADILARAAGENVVLTDVYGDATSASISTSENAMQALAFGNRSTANSVSVNATNIDTSVDGSPLRGTAEYDAVTYDASVDASFAAQNAQTSSGSVTASLLTAGIDPTSAQIRTQIGESITGTSVVSDDNISAAAATGNRAATSVALDANQLATTAGVQNVQVTSSTLAALIGVAGTAGSPGDPGTPDTPVAASGGSVQGIMSQSGDTITVSGEPVIVTFADYSFTADEVAYLNGLDGVSGATLGGSTVSFEIGSVDTSVFNNVIFNSGADGQGSGDETFTVSGFTIPGTPATPATLATPNQGGVTVAIGDDVIDSSVSVQGNSTSGSVLGNSASNSLVAAATDISGGSGQTSSTASGLSTTGDLVVSNVQMDNAATETSSVYGTFAIDATAGDISGSSLTVSNNSQRSDAGSNLATNTLAVSATNLDAGTSLGSAQQSAAAVSAVSALDVFAPGASTQSTTKMNDNTNTARAVVNEAGNTVMVSATNTDPVSAPNLVSVPTMRSLAADHALVTVQTATGSAASTASSQIYNGDAAELTTDGLYSGSIEIAGNATTAQSVANLASNAMTVEASANQGASAGVSNVQVSSAVVTANATSTAGIVLAGDETAIPDTAAANDSSIRIRDNTTTAVARGNSASNVLNMDAGATYGTAGAGTPGVDFGASGVTTFAATAGVLNQQSNTGTVSANSTGVTYQVALNAETGTPTVGNSVLGVSGNAVNAEAYGNTASNRLVMTALNTGTASAAIGNYQTNTAGVTATVTSVGYGVAAGSGVIGGSTFSTMGNQVAATAVGNNAVSVIAAGN